MYTKKTGTHYALHKHMNIKNINIDHCMNNHKHKNLTYSLIQTHIEVSGPTYQTSYRINHYNPHNLQRHVALDPKSHMP